MGLAPRLHYILWRHETNPALRTVTDVFDLSPFSAMTVLIAGHEGRWVVAVALTVAFTLLARGVRGVTNSGALAGAVSCFRTLRGRRAGGLRGADYASSRWPGSRPGSVMHASRSWGPRSGARAGRHPRSLANLGVATACAAASIVSHDAGNLAAGDGGCARGSCRRHGFQRSGPGLRGEGPPGHDLAFRPGGDRWRGKPDWDRGWNRRCRNCELGLPAGWIAAPADCWQFPSVLPSWA